MLRPPFSSTHPVLLPGAATVVSTCGSSCELAVSGFNKKRRKKKERPMTCFFIIIVWRLMASISGLVSFQ